VSDVLAPAPSTTRGSGVPDDPVVAEQLADGLPSAAGPLEEVREADRQYMQYMRKG
jgi:hypothetical protein